jgi:hypothetical protein
MMVRQPPPIDCIIRPGRLRMSRTVSGTDDLSLHGLEIDGERSNFAEIND